MRRCWWALAAALALAGCGTSPASRPPVRIAVSSPAFQAGGPIPQAYTCQGEDISLPLRFSGAPRGTRELELVMRDPDAPGGNFIHWRLSMPPSTRTLSAGQMPAGAKSGPNSFGHLGYRGPCPPAGPAHHYVITVTATSGGAVLGKGTLIGTYARR